MSSNRHYLSTFLVFLLIGLGRRERKVEVGRGAVLSNFSAKFPLSVGGVYACLCPPFCNNIPNSTVTINKDVEEAKQVLWH
jgi:hypothetical protein